MPVDIKTAYPTSMYAELQAVFFLLAKMCICLQMRLSKLSHVMVNLLTPVSIIDSGDQADCLVVLGMATSKFMKTGILMKSELLWKLRLSTVPPDPLPVF